MKNLKTFEKFSKDIFSSPQKMFGHTKSIEYTSDYLWILILTLSIDPNLKSFNNHINESKQPNYPRRQGGGGGGGGGGTLPPVMNLFATIMTLFEQWAEREASKQPDKSGDPKAYCKGIPNPGSAVSNLSFVGPNDYFELRVERGSVNRGIKYQWQLSPNDEEWFDIVDATEMTLRTRQDSDNYYRLSMFCTYSNRRNCSKSILVKMKSQDQLRIEALKEDVKARFNSLEPNLRKEVELFIKRELEAIFKEYTAKIVQNKDLRTELILEMRGKILTILQNKFTGNEEVIGIIQDFIEFFRPQFRI